MWGCSWWVSVEWTQAHWPVGFKGSCKGTVLAVQLGFSFLREGETKDKKLPKIIFLT